MFTGLVEGCGFVLDNQAHASGNRLTIDIPFSVICPGESIAVQGVCLTALAESTSALVCDISPETLACTTLGALVTGDRVNLERAMHATGRFGGHYVSGHIDTKAHMLRRREVGDYIEMIIGGFAECDMLYLLPKGSITVNGVSLTINRVVREEISVLLVPHTMQHTTLPSYAVGAAMNIEFDYLARVVAHQVEHIIAQNLMKKNVAG